MIVLSRVGHFLVTAASAISGVVLEVFTVAPGIATHLGAVGPFMIFVANWVHAEITKTTLPPPGAD